MKEWRSAAFSRGLRARKLSTFREKKPAVRFSFSSRRTLKLLTKARKIRHDDIEHYDWAPTPEFSYKTVGSKFGGRWDRPSRSNVSRSSARSAGLARMKPLDP